MSSRQNGMSRPAAVSSDVSGNPRISLPHSHPAAGCPTWPYMPIIHVYIRSSLGTPLYRDSSFQSSAGDTYDMIATWCGLFCFAISHCTFPRYEPPYVAMRPSDHDWFAIQVITSLPSGPSLRFGANL